VKRRIRVEDFRPIEKKPLHPIEMVLLLLMVGKKKRKIPKLESFDL
jgi:hypothetical protein